MEQVSYPGKQWHDKRYYSLDAYCKNTYGEKLYKIALDAGMTCPNRDGSLDTRGCIFCSAGGSGDFAVPCSVGRPDASGISYSTDGSGAPASSGSAKLSAEHISSIKEQLDKGRSLFGAKKTGSRFIAYFQSYTNTYAPPRRLESLYTAALEEPSVAGISIATRPDCLPSQVLSLLQRLQQAYPDKFIWVELGLQTIHPKTADFIRRGYPPCRF